jgi:FAD/FMN-containing dehydrogenase
VRLATSRPTRRIYDNALSDLPAFFRALYFAAQRHEVTPTCAVQPRSAEDVALAARIIAEAHSGGDDDKCIFAVKSGDHGIFACASNAPGGVTIDLRYLDDVSVAEDRKTVALGLGNK